MQTHLLIIFQITIQSENVCLFSKKFLKKLLLLKQFITDTGHLLYFILYSNEEFIKNVFLGLQIRKIKIIL